MDDWILFTLQTSSGGLGTENHKVLFSNPFQLNIGGGSPVTMEDSNHAAEGGDVEVLSEGVADGYETGAVGRK